MEKEGEVTIWLERKEFWGNILRRKTTVRVQLEAVTTAPTFFLTGYVLTAFCYS